MRKHRIRGARNGERSTRIVRALALFVFVFFVFALGFMLRGNEALMERLGMDSASSGSGENPGMTVLGSTYDSAAARVAEVQGILDTYSLDEYDLDEASEAMIEALLASADNPGLHYYSEEEYAAYRENDEDDSYGIGVLFGDYNGQAYAVDLIGGGPAQAAGVETGDFIVSINGDRRDDGWSLEEAIKAVEGDEGSQVVITWRRPESLDASGGEEFTTTLICSSATEENVTWSLEDEVGYIDIRQLGTDTDEYVERAITRLEKRGAKAFVLDLRDVSGGYLTQAVDIVSLFQEGGTVVRIQYSDSESTRSTNGEVATTAPLAILINSSTAGAAEVLAASLQDDGRATLIGATTQGQGTVQVMRELSFGGAVSYTAARYLTPNGRSFDGMGISPDIKASAGGKDSDEDTQKDIAIEDIASQIGD